MNSVLPTKLIRVKTCFSGIFSINTSTSATSATSTTSIASPPSNKAISTGIEPTYCMDYDEEALHGPEQDAKGEDDEQWW